MRIHDYDNDYSKDLAELLPDNGVGEKFKTLGPEEDSPSKNNRTVVALRKSNLFLWAILYGVHRMLTLNNCNFSITRIYTDGSLSRENRFNAKNIDYLMWTDHHCKILSISSTETQKKYRLVQ